MGSRTIGLLKRARKNASENRLRTPFNLTGTIIHTNLGRALLSKELWNDIEPLVTRPMNLEYDLVKGSRGQRDTAVEERLCELMRCEAVTIVNNNAAALMLVLNTFGLNAEVAVARRTGRDRRQLRTAGTDEPRWLSPIRGWHYQSYPLR